MSHQTDTNLLPSAMDTDKKNKPEPCLSAVVSSKSIADEINGPKGPEPTRFGDWERKGRCIDF